MKIKIEHGQTTAQCKTGYFSHVMITAHELRLIIDFTEEEKSIIASYGIADYLFYNEPADPFLVAGRIVSAENWVNLGLGAIKVRSLLPRCDRVIRYISPIERQKGEVELYEALKSLKETMTAGSPLPRNTIREFEL